MRERMLTAHGETRSVDEWARLKGLTKTILTMRLDRGWSPERAVDTPQRAYKARPRRTYACPDGVKRTVREMADMASVSEAAMRMRLKNGWSVERALTEPPVTRDPLDIDGESLTLEEWTRRSGVPRSVVTSRLRQGWNAKDAADRANDQAVADLIAARENLDRADSELAAAKKAFEQAKVNQPSQPDQPSKPSQPNQPSQTVAVKKSHDDNKTRIENGIALQKVTNKADRVMASTGADTAAIAIVSMTLVMGAAGVEIVRRGRHHA